MDFRSIRPGFVGLIAGIIAWLFFMVCLAMIVHRADLGDLWRALQP